jgi:hypothetical protein
LRDSTADQKGGKTKTTLVLSTLLLPFAEALFRGM